LESLLIIGGCIFSAHLFDRLLQDHISPQFIEDSLELLHLLWREDFLNLFISADPKLWR